MQQALLDRASQLGDPISSALRDVLTIQGPPPSSAYLEAVFEAVESMPGLKETEFGHILVRAATGYSTDTKSAAFAEVLQAAVRVCQPKSMEVLAQFVTSGRSFMHRGEATMRPDLRSGLILLTVLGKAGLHPKSEPALLNCCRLFKDESVSVLATNMMAHTVERMHATFARAAAGEPMNW